MVTARESRAALLLLTNQAVATGRRLLTGTSGNPEARRLELLDGTPELISYFTDGSAALAADFYEDQRELANVPDRYVPDLVVADRTVKIRRAIAWSAEPLFAGDELTASSRLAEVIQLETARPYRETILANRRQDPESVGWRRISAGGCPFCRMLADKGAIFKEDTSRFAAHENCHCTAEPVFSNGASGPEASSFQYMASKRRRTAKQKAELRSYLATYYSA